jgi:ribosomal protein L29
MKYKELCKMNIKEISNNLFIAKDKLFKLKYNNFHATIKNTSIINKTRKYIARLLTYLKKHKIKN